jgi:hypothetical protein
MSHVTSPRTVDPNSSYNFEITFDKHPMGLIFAYRKDRHIATVAGFDTLKASLGKSKRYY